MWLKMREVSKAHQEKAETVSSLYSAYSYNSLVEAVCQSFPKISIFVSWFCVKEINNSDLSEKVWQG